MYPDLGQVMGNRPSAVFKITMAVYAKSVEAKDDLRSFVWDFGQEYNQVKRNFSLFLARKFKLTSEFWRQKSMSQFPEVFLSIFGKKIQFCGQTPF